MPKINLTTFFTSLGITGGNTQATNFYDFWKGIEFSGGTITYNITDFMTYLGTNRYEFFHSLESTYPGVFDEYTFYKNIDDVRIYDFKTFYEYAGEYFGGGVVSYQIYIDDNNWAFPECQYGIAPIIVYANNNNPQIGDTLYTDSNLTTPYVGQGMGAYVRWGLDDITVIGNYEISSGGIILTNELCS